MYGVHLVFGIEFVYGETSCVLEDATLCCIHHDVLLQSSMLWIGQPTWRQ